MFAKRMLISGLMTLTGTPSLAADLMPSAFTPKSALEAGTFGFYYDYEKRSTMHLDPYGLQDRTVTTERSTLGTGIGLPHGFQLSLGLSGISSQSRSLGNEKRFAGGMVSLEKLTEITPSVAFGLGVFAEGASAGATSPKDQSIPSPASHKAPEAREEDSETGISTEASPAVGRSGSARGGVFGRVLVGKRILRGNLHGGVRYRDPEDYFWYRMRHETFFQSQLEVWPMTIMGVFFQYRQRNLQLADTRRDDISYRTKELIELRGGALFRMGAVEASVFGGAADLNNNDKHGFGTGRKIVGASLALTLGEKSPETPQTDRNKVRSETRYPKSTNPELSRGDEIILDASTLARPPQKDIGTVMDDFELVDQRLRKSNLRKNLKTEDELANEEIERLKEVSDKQEKLRLEREEAEELLQAKRKADGERLRRDIESDQELSRDVKDDVRALPAVHSNDVKWNGLD